MFTEPMKSKAHERLEILKKRSNLSLDQHNSLNRMSTGYKGELEFFNLLQSELQCKPILLFNLHLKVNGSECQIDCLLIFQSEVILMEVKNYQGDFLIEHDDWYTLDKGKIKNPLHQLHRTELLLNQFLKQHQFPLRVKSFIIFIHPEFQLYQSHTDMPIVFPAQHKRFIRKLQNIPCRIRQQHHKIAETLKARHESTSAYEANLVYNYTDFKKGVTCEKCDGLMEEYGTKNMRCAICKGISHIEFIIMRNIYDFHTLFPDEKITVSTMTEWTDYIISKHRIRTILTKYCHAVKKGKNSHYLLPLTINNNNL